MTTSTHAPINTATAELALGVASVSPATRALLRAGKQIVIVAVSAAVVTLFAALTTGQPLTASLLVSALTTLIAALVAGIEKYVTANAEPALADIVTRVLDYAQSKYLIKAATVDQVPVASIPAAAVTTATTNV